MKKKADRLGSDPFENMLPHLTDSRKKKEADTSNDDDKSTSIDASKSADKDKTINASKSTSTITSKDTGASNGINKSTAKSESETKSISVSTVNGESKNADKSAVAYASNGITADTDNGVGTGKSTITIARKSKGSTLVKMTYYFRPDQLKAIDELHEKSGRDKSELVRMAVDLLVENARVE